MVFGISKDSHDESEFKRDKEESEVEENIQEAFN